MIHRPLPDTDLCVSLLAFGNFTFGATWWSDASDDEAVAIQNHAVERGVNFFDTAPAYGNYRAEKLLARTIQDVGRDQLVISTKFGYDLETDPGEEGSHRERRQDFSAAALRRECEQSLARMGIETIDLYQAHNIRLPHYTDELVNELEALQREGKIKAWGVALGPAIGWREEGHAAILQHNAATVQTVYNLYEQHPARELCELAAAATPARGIIARVPTNSGILDDEFSSPDFQFPAHDHRKFRDRDWLTFGLQKNDIVRPMAADLGLSLRAFAFKWLAAQPAIISIEPNLISTQDVDDFVEACDGDPLPADVLTTLHDLYEDDFNLGPSAAPCDLKSTVAPTGKEPSSYRPPVMS